jgi:hypothetical protein
MAILVLARSMPQNKKPLRDQILVPQGLSINNSGGLDSGFNLQAFQLDSHSSWSLLLMTDLYPPIKSSALSRAVVSNRVGLTVADSFNALTAYAF